MTREPADRLPAGPLAVLLAACLLARRLCRRRRAERRPDGRAASRTTISPSPSTSRRRGSGPTTAASASPSTGPSCARRRITSRRPGGSSSTGHPEEALIEYQIAAELNPGNGDIQTEMRALRTQLRTQGGGRRPRGQDHARDADQGEPRRAPARRRRAHRRHAARHADLPRGQRPRHLHRDRQVRRTSAWSSTRRSAISR